MAVLTTPIRCHRLCQGWKVSHNIPSTISNIARSMCWPRLRLASNWRRDTPKVRSSERTVETIESIRLLSFPEKFAEDAGPAAVDMIWSLQYMAPGALCGAAGPVKELAVAGNQQTADQQLRFNHAVLLRFPNTRNLEAFQQHPKSKETISAVLAGACQGMAVLTVPTQLPNNLESLFRRGGEFEIGFELIAALRLTDGASRSDAEDVLGQLQQLAGSELFGAVQAYQGPCTAVQHLHSAPADAASSAAKAGSSGVALEADYVLLARFQLLEQLQEFLRCPPVAALLQGDARLPLRTEWAGVMEVAPAENSNSSRQGRGGLL